MSLELLEAVRSGNAVLAGELIGRGESPDTRDEKGNTLLMIASYSGNTQLVRQLLDLGANVHLENTSGWTALFMACHNPELDRGFPDVVEMLIEAGADIEKTIGYGIRPLMLAAGYGESPVVEVLLEAGAEPKAANEGGRTARQMATDKNYVDVVNLLWEAETSSGEASTCSSASVVTFHRK